MDANAERLSRLERELEAADEEWQQYQSDLFDHDEVPIDRRDEEWEQRRIELEGSRRMAEGVSAGLQIAILDAKRAIAPRADPTGSTGVSGPLSAEAEAAIDRASAPRHGLLITIVVSTILLALALGGWFLFGRNRNPSTTKVATATTSSASARPVVQSFTARFDQATFSTTYTVVARDPDGGTLDYRWKLIYAPGDEQCGTFTPSGTTARWVHPHEDQRDRAAGFTGTYCKATAQGQGGHKGTVRVTIRNADWECSVDYQRGSVDGTVENLADLDCDRR